MSDDYIYSERSYDTQPFTRPEIIFINDDLIPFYNNMIDRYSPDAIALVTVKKCPSLQELETNSYEPVSYTHLDTSGQWHKVSPSKELSDYLVEAFKDRLKPDK